MSDMNVVKYDKVLHSTSFQAVNEKILISKN